MTDRTCKDCLAEWVAESRPPSKRTARAAPYPGPRCTTHWRAFRKRIRENAWAAHIHERYGITADFYRQVLAVQGGKCAICQRATGAARRLAVDHDHKQAVLDGHAEDHGCPNCVRGLLCKTCNRNVLGHLRDDPAAFQRAIDYLRSWPTARARSASATAGSTASTAGSSAAGAPEQASSESRT